MQGIIGDNTEHVTMKCATYVIKPYIRLRL